MVVLTAVFAIIQRETESRVEPPSSENAHESFQHHRFSFDTSFVFMHVHSMTFTSSHSGQETGHGVVGIV